MSRLDKIFDMGYKKGLEEALKESSRGGIMSCEITYNRLKDFLKSTQLCISGEVYIIINHEFKEGMTTCVNLNTGELVHFDDNMKISNDDDMGPIMHLPTWDAEKVVDNVCKYVIDNDKRLGERVINMFKKYVDNLPEPTLNQKRKEYGLPEIKQKQQQSEVKKI